MILITFLLKPIGANTPTVAEKVLFPQKKVALSFFYLIVLISYF